MRGHNKTPDAPMVEIVVIQAGSIWVRTVASALAAPGVDDVAFIELEEQKVRPFRENQDIEQIGYAGVAYPGLGVGVEINRGLFHLDAHVYGVERTGRNCFMKCAIPTG